MHNKNRVRPIFCCNDSTFSSPVMPYVAILPHCHDERVLEVDGVPLCVGPSLVFADGLQQRDDRLSPIATLRVLALRLLVVCVRIAVYVTQ